MEPLVTYSDNFIIEKDFDPSQPRDQRGRWSETGATAAAQAKPFVVHMAQHEESSGLYYKKVYDSFVKAFSALGHPLQEIVRIEEALFHYQGFGFDSINKYLRSGEEGFRVWLAEHIPLSRRRTEEAVRITKEQVRYIEKSFLPLRMSTVLYRGLGTNRERFEQFRAAKSFHDPAFASASTTLHTALRFAGRGSLGGHIPANPLGRIGDSLLLRLIMPKGSRLSVPAALSRGRIYDHEREVLLPPGTQFQPVAYHTAPHTDWPGTMHVLTARPTGERITKVVPYQEAEPYRDEDEFIAGQSGTPDGGMDADNWFDEKGGVEATADLDEGGKWADEVQVSGPQATAAGVKLNLPKGDDGTPGSKLKAKGRPRVL